MWRFEVRRIARRTGLQLAATEQRDEWGMEPLESLPFSPDPEGSRDDIDNRGFEIAQPLFGDAYSREMDMSEESPLLAWQTQSCSPKSTSVDPSPATAGHDADTSEDTYESGRMSIPPISIWRGDKIVEGKEVVSDTAKKDRFVVPTVQEVIRAPDNIAESSKYKARKKREGGGKNSTQKANIMQQEEWEMTLGRKSVACRLKQSENGDDASDGGVSAYCDLDVAFTSDRILGVHYPKKKVHSGQVRVLDFNPSGIMNLPAGSKKAYQRAKTIKNIFFVHTGQVTVAINTKSFKVTAGSVFVVPKGMF
ncbi:centromere associated protein [Fusarium bulbicola]|nr:centromere associated protein [Fusarium bulbicola]